MYRINHLHLFLIFLVIFLFIFNNLVNKEGQHKLSSNTKINQEEYDNFKNKLLNITEQENPRTALSVLAHGADNNPAIMDNCHAFSHEIGRSAYKKYKDFGESVKYYDKMCNSGYLHGIIEAYFSKSKDILSDLKTICDSYDLGSFLSLQCYHGVGHGLMYYTSNDVSQSLNMCDSYSDNFSRSNCALGIFMENFDTDQKIHPSKFAKENDLFYPCQEQEARYKYECYSYSPIHYLSLNKGDYTGALVWCEKAEKQYQAACAQGVGVQTMNDNIDNPQFIEAICMSGKVHLRAPCIDGVVSVYINHYSSLEPAKLLCKQLGVINRLICNDSVNVRVSLFTN